MIDTEEKRRTRPVFYIALAIAILASAAIWWLNRPPSYDFAEVSGVVTLDGKPIDQVEVRFLPDPVSGTRGPVSSCFTDKDGRYTIRCDKFDQNGAVIGTHRVVIFDITALPDIGMPDGSDDPVAPKAKTTRRNEPKPSRLPGKYEHLSTTPFTGVKIEQGKHEMNFDLMSKAK